jgi:putative uncharacterized protein (fragment)
MGIGMGIDETSLNGDLYTILINKAARGGKGTIVAMIKGTRTSDIIRVLDRLPATTRDMVTEVSMDFSDSMAAAVKAVFPNAEIIIDCFHIIKRCVEGVEELRLKCKREAIKERRKAETAHKKKLEARVAARRKYREKHPKKYKGRKRGRKPQRSNARFIPQTLANGDTKIELLTRSRGLLATSGDKWSDPQKERAALLFAEYPKLKEAHGLLCSLRTIFSNHSLNKEEAKEKLQAWYGKIAKCTMKELKAVRETIKSREDEVLNYFHKFTTNANSESFNSKIKGFLAQLHGVSDMSFFMYRLSCIWG